MWIDAQAVYRACYSLMFLKIEEKKQLKEFYLQDILKHKQKFSWKKLKYVWYTKSEAMGLLNETSYGDMLRYEFNKIDRDIDDLRVAKDIALESVKILSDGTCSVGQATHSMLQPYLNGQKRIEDDSRSD